MLDKSLFLQRCFCGIMHVKEEVPLNEIELELQMKKAEMISSKIGHVPVATIHYNLSKVWGRSKKKMSDI